MLTSSYSSTIKKDLQKLPGSSTVNKNDATKETPFGQAVNGDFSNSQQSAYVKNDENLTKTSKTSPNDISGILSKKKIILKKIISKDKNEISTSRNNSSDS